MSKPSKPAIENALARARRNLAEVGAEEDAEVTRAALGDPDALPSDALFARRRGRPFSETTKTKVSIRLDADLVERLRERGRGWQTDANDMLRKAVGLEK